MMGTIYRPRRFPVEHSSSASSWRQVA